MKERVKKFVKEHETEILFFTNCATIGITIALGIRFAQATKALKGFSGTAGSLVYMEDGSILNVVRFKNGYTDVVPIEMLDAKSKESGT